MKKTYEVRVDRISIRETTMHVSIDATGNEGFNQRLASEKAANKAGDVDFNQFPESDVSYGTHVIQETSKANDGYAFKVAPDGTVIDVTDKIDVDGTVCLKPPADDDRLVYVPAALMDYIKGPEDG